ncbi:MAG: hypothetical protein AVDCRST_MAG83-2112 [uncultured Arthrobacter sp.]|uniref:Peptidase M24 domain-containing protein n=1 Tax=uncultured Arthrobacter sp. TaxID=114050 RepID=A0A6J4I6I4_9MICC|nr:Xaa-Pro peptidase family protein [uncultured Arthrobacter sp.]CAA9243698.1 MAG: hypothetical protein AVDCRST_MAG83-2112 [uncultured Arthrobacter sp.]
MAAPTIPTDEFAQRRARACAAAAERGFHALVVWSRGGATADFYGDVMYLANHVTAFPTQPDNLPLWAARGHSVLVLPVSGEPVLVVDSYDYRQDLATVSDVRVGLHIPALVAEVLKELGLEGSPLGLIGRESFLHSSYGLLEHHLGYTPDLTACDEILTDLRLIKSSAELDLMRAAATIGSEAMTEMLAAVRVGGNEGEVAGEGWRAAARRGGFPYDTSITSGPHSQHFQWARLPSWDIHRPLERGDILHVDFYGPMSQGYWVDMARTTIVGTGPTRNQAAVLEGAVTLVEHITAEIRPGITYGELWQVGDDWRQTHGFPVRPEEGSGCLVGLDADFPAYGHSLGLGLEGYYLQEGSALVVQPGMVISVETLLSREDVGGANFEQNVIVTADGHELLTGASPAMPWQ